MRGRSSRASASSRAQSQRQSQQGQQQVAQLLARPAHSATSVVQTAAPITRSTSATATKTVPPPTSSRARGDLPPTPPQLPDPDVRVDPSATDHLSARSAVAWAMSCSWGADADPHCTAGPPRRSTTQRAKRIARASSIGPLGRDDTASPESSEHRGTAQQHPPHLLLGHPRGRDPAALGDETAIRSSHPGPASSTQRASASSSARSRCRQHQQTGPTRGGSRSCFTDVRHRQRGWPALVT